MQDNRVVAVRFRCVTIKDIISNYLKQIFAQQFEMFSLLTFKSQILVDTLLTSEATFWMHNTIALIISCSATNAAFAL